MINYHVNEIKEILNYFDTSYLGLDNEKIIKNRKKYGTNELKEKKKKSKTRVFLEQFQDLLVIILIASALVSVFIGEFASTIVIFSVISLNAILGTYQYFKADKSLDSLKKLTNPNVTVYRNGIIETISSSEVVCGDIVVVKAGDMICADGRLIEANSLEINESSLTGESLAVNKQVMCLEKENLILAEQKNMLFSGTFCISGTGKYVVCATGMDTEIGKIAKMINNAKQEKTPLQLSLDSFSKVLAIMIIIICMVVFVFSIYRHMSILDSLMFAVSLAVAAIPEALATIVVIVLAIGTERMATENAIIKELNAVETLGCINVICTDKTGTLTQNKLEVAKVEVYGNKQSFYQTLFLASSNNNQIDDAIIKYLKYTTEKNHFIKDNNFMLLFVLPHTSTRKMSSILYKTANQNLMYSKGAAEIILQKCRFLKTEFGSEIMNNDTKIKITTKINQYASQGFKTLGIAYKNMSFKNIITGEDETDLTLVGLVMLMDPIRKESKQAVIDSISAGIKPVMLTGDHKETAIYIAKQVGIYKNDDLVMSGDELDRLTDLELNREISKISVFSRLNPLHKIRIVKAYQQTGAIVAMTGDGINDAPALRQADIGISMGKSGTEVAKDASSMILTDDNFSTIVKAVSNGRLVYQNIQNAISFLVSGNFAGILVVLFAAFFNLPVPFAAVHLLFINLLTDSLPAISIGMENTKNDMLKKKPRDKNKKILSKQLLLKIIFEGLLIALCCLYSYRIGLQTSINVARTMTFATLCLARLFHSFNCNQNKSFLTNGMHNTYLILSFLIGILLINAALFIPELRILLKTEALTKYQLLCVYACSILPLLFIQTSYIIKDAVFNRHL